MESCDCPVLQGRGVTVEQEVCLLHAAVGGQPLQQEVADALGLLRALPRAGTRPSVPVPLGVSSKVPCCALQATRVMSLGYLPKRVLEQ